MSDAREATGPNPEEPPQQPPSGHERTSDTVSDAREATDGNVEEPPRPSPSGHERTSDPVSDAREATGPKPEEPPQQPPSGHERTSDTVSDAREATGLSVDVPSGRAASIPTPLPGDSRLASLSLNQRTTPAWGVADAVAGCLRAGLPAIGLWREPAQEAGLDRSAALVRDAGLRVSSLCRGGFLTADDPATRKAALDDNRRAVDEAATLGAPCLVMVVGGLPVGSRDLRGARARVADGIAELAPYAAERGVQLALEPLHPMYCADRAVLSTLRQALDLAEQFPVDQVGVAVDTFHVWWDPDVWTQIARAGARIASYQVCDMLDPIPADNLLARAMMGDGVIEFPPLTQAVWQAGYAGDIEVEIFNADVWAADPDEVVATMKRRFVEVVLPD